MRHLLYLDEPRAVLVEQHQNRPGWHTQRFVLVTDEGPVRGAKSMYPLLPVGVEPVTIDRETFDEAWEGANV